MFKETDIVKDLPRSGRLSVSEAIVELNTWWELEYRLDQWWEYIFRGNVKSIVEMKSRITVVVQSVDPAMVH
ncbi:hypothetical protein TNCV_3140611 [Trichonephila clavipes]|nr:hypothetical protein TNCV_3140611 [Trichonephila clavipes]